MVAFAFVSLLIILLAFSVMWLGFRAGFLGYINDNRYQSLVLLQQAVQENTQTQDDWERLSHQKRYWHRLIESMLRENDQNIFISRSTPPQKKDRPPHHDHRRPKPPKRPPAPLPFLLLDNEEQRIYGPKNFSIGIWLLPITINKQTIAYVGLEPLKEFSSEADKLFVTQQTHYFIGIAMIAMMIALLVSALLAHWMVKPVQRLAKAMEALMRRDYSVNVDYNSGDEIGNLVVSFNRLVSALKDHDQSQQQWIADISHELRTPLATLKAEVEAIQDGVREFSAERLQSLYEEVLRLQRIVDDLHQLTLADAGALRYYFEMTSLVKVIEQVLWRHEALITQQGLNHELTVIGAEKAIYGDGDRLSQLFTNLLQNSVRYTKQEGQVYITVCFKDNGCVSVLWEDSDPGVNDEHLEKLFDRLYREEKSRNREKGGSGLGLAICRSIVSAHQGNITARHSRLGGLAIEIDFPIMKS